MPRYRIHRLKDHLRQQFRSAPHVSGTASVKPRDYGVNLDVDPSPDAGASIDAATPYAAFFALQEAGDPLLLGDLLESETRALRIFKFVGFEEAQWVLPDAPPQPVPPLEPFSASTR